MSSLSLSGSSHSSSSSEEDYNAGRQQQAGPEALRTAAINQLAQQITAHNQLQAAQFNQALDAFATIVQEIQASNKASEQLFVVQTAEIAQNPVFMPPILRMLMEEHRQFEEQKIQNQQNQNLVAFFATAAIINKTTLEKEAQTQSQPKIGSESDSDIDVD